MLLFVMKTPNEQIQKKVINMHVAIVILVMICHLMQAQESNAVWQNYLDPIKLDLNKKWPENRTINLVFHGHSVPAGYFKTPTVNTLDSYPMQVLKGLKEIYPHAVINTINTAIGGENAKRGATRFKNDVLPHKPDVVFIDYALNDRNIGLQEAHGAWQLMIEQALDDSLKVILLTPSPDQREDLFDDSTELAKHSAQIKLLAAEYGIGLVDSYAAFQTSVGQGQSLESLMSQGNHPNKLGHHLIAEQILRFFSKN